MNYLRNIISKKYSRLPTLSDPFHDFDSEEDKLHLQQICRKSIDCFGWEELCRIFQGCFPAGTFEECIYYLPKALEFIDSDAAPSSDMVDNLSFWMANDSIYQKLNEAKLFDEILIFFTELFQKKTQEFIFEANGYPKNINLISTIVESFNHSKDFIFKNIYDNFGDILIQKSLFPIDNDKKMKWILCLLEDGAKYSQILDKLYKDEKFKKIAYYFIVNEVAIENNKNNVKYWSYLSDNLGLF